MADKIRVKITSPEKVVFDRKVDSVLIPATNGRLEVLPRRAPMITALDTGIVTVNDGGNRTVFVIEKGMADFNNDECFILTDNAMELHKSNRLDIAALLTTYKKDMKQTTNHIEREMIRDHILYAEMLLDAIDNLKK